MASNFELFFHQTRDSLHLKLYGDFDGSSAHELLNVLIEHVTDAHQIFIDTNDLNTIHPFGQEVFKKNLDTIHKEFMNIIFIGKNKQNIAPERSNYVD
jgi:anti-anti-sigma regulatory factor